MNLREKLTEKYQYIFSEELIEDIVSVGNLKHVKAGFSMMEIGDPLTFMPLILNGAVKVMGEGDEEHEYLLYYLEVGDSCAMTLSCCMRGKKSAIKAVADQDTEMIVIPVSKMEEWIVKHREWRAFVFESYENRMAELLETIDILAFHNMEERIYKYLKDRSLIVHSTELDITHYQIANDLNTSRVVVSRLIKKMALSGIIETHRNAITLTPSFFSAR